MATTIERACPLAEEQSELLAQLPRGTFITITKASEDHEDSLDYVVHGRYCGLEHRVSGTWVRVLPADRIERRVPLPAGVAVDAP